MFYGSIERRRGPRSGTWLQFVPILCLVLHVMCETVSMCTCMFNLARDRYLASGYGHAMGFDSPAGQPAFEPSGPNGL